MAARISIPSCLARFALGLCCVGVLGCGAAKPGAQQPPSAVNSASPSAGQGADRLAVTPDPARNGSATTSPAFAGVAGHVGALAGHNSAPMAALAAFSGSGGANVPVLPDAGIPATGSSGMSAVPTQIGASGTAGGAGPLTLTPTDAKPLSDGFFAFPASAVPPTNQSPGYRWTGVPASAKSLALVFRDVSSTAAMPPVKWILWDIPATLTQVPANMGNSAHPMLVPGSSQLGSLGNQGYAGPCCDDHDYEWILYALDVEKLSGTERLSTAQIRTDLLLQHDVAQSKPVMMRIMQ